MKRRRFARRLMFCPHCGWRYNQTKTQPYMNQRCFFDGYRLQKVRERTMLVPDPITTQPGVQTRIEATT